MKELNLYQKICEVMRIVTTVYKAKTIQAGKSSYRAVSHDDVAALLHLPIANIGIVIMPSIINRKIETAQVTNKYDGTVSDQFRVHLTVEVMFINADKPEERHSVLSDGWSFDNSDKAVGKALSYAVKSAMLKTFMLESSDNEEDRPNAGHDQVSVKKVLQKTDERDTVLLGIKEMLSEHTRGQAIEKKIAYLEEMAGVKGMNDLTNLPLKDIIDIYNKLKGI